MSSAEINAREDATSHLSKVLDGVRVKTKAAMDSGPFGDPISVTPEEATLIYRLLFERK